MSFIEILFWLSSIFFFVAIVFDKNIFVLFGFISLAPKVLNWFGNIGYYTYSGLPIAEFIQVIAMLLITIIVAFAVKHAYNTNKIKKKEEREKKEKEDAFRLGKWEFPALRFYQECRSSNVLPSNNDDFSKRKVLLIVQSYYEKAGMPKEYWDLYNSRLEEYYNVGHREEQNQKAAEKLKKLTPVPGEFAEVNEAVLYFTGEAAKNSNGIEKRKTNLEALILKEEKIKDQYAQQLRDLRGVTTYTSTEKSWVPSAILGGVLAGPAGAVLGGYSAMKNNESEIKSNVFWAGEAFRNQARGAVLASQIEPFYESAKERRNKLIEEFYECDKKVVMLPQENITEKVNIENILITKTESKILKLKAKIETTVAMPNENMRLDGFIHAKVYRGDIFVDDMYIPLPLHGISTGERVDIYGVCKNAIDYKTGYRAEICDSSFFFVEKLTNDSL